MVKIMLAGPTLFAPMLKKWNDMVAFECEKNNKKYYTYLILTDGMTHDIEDTIEQVIISTRLPVSIIIIGIGDADFSNMEFLDSDVQPLFCHKTQTFSRRDNVQFVQFNKYKHNVQKLAQETLAELPRQMVDYFLSMGITPEDMAVSQDYQEARDYFSSQAMQFMSSEHLEQYSNQEQIQEVMQ